jgi:hypothetical protein
MNLSVLRCFIHTLTYTIAVYHVGIKLLRGSLLIRLRKPAEHNIILGMMYDYALRIHSIDSAAVPTCIPHAVASHVATHCWSQYVYAHAQMTLVLPIEDCLVLY